MRPTSILDNALPSSLVLVLVGISSFAPVSHAAASEDLTCIFTGVLNFSPPLTLANTRSVVSIVGSLTDCTSPNGRYPHLVSGTYEGHGAALSTGAISCSLQSVSEIGTIAWDNGQSSSVESILNSDTASSGTLQSTGKVVDGVLQGDSFTVLPTAIPNADCDTVGLMMLTLTGPVHVT